jgi:glucose/arabinose dehydrogenase
MRVRPLLASAALVAASVVAGTAVSQAATPTRAPGAVRVTFHRLVGGFSNPVYVTAARDGSRRLFVVQQGGIVRVVKSGAVQPRAYLNLTSEVLSVGEEQGLLSIAFHPHFAQHPFVFVAYTRSDKALQVSRFRASSSSARSIARSTEVRLFAAPHPNASNHNGGQLMFGRGGYLFVTTGDGGGGDDQFRNAERLTSLSGKILRLDVDHACGGRHYCIPASNPFPHSTNARKRLVFDWGLRNPWRASIDRADGSLWIGDVGQSAWEEIDHVGVRAGVDFGWSCMEGRVRDPNGASCAGRHLRGPVTVYDHSGNRVAVIGGYAYHGPDYPFAHGLYVFADYGSGETWVLGRTKRGGYPRALVGHFGATFSLSGFGEGDGGEIYAVDQSSGSLWHVVFHRA